MIIGIVIPTYNRINNLKLCFIALEKQSYSNFTVVVADDGSTDGTSEYIASLSSFDFWKTRLKYIRCGTNTGVRTGRARNIGVKHLHQKCRHLLMLDADVILGPTTLAVYFEHIKRDPGKIVMGRTDWLPPMSLDKIEEYLSFNDIESLRHFIPSGEPRRVEGTFVGRELRESILPEFWTGEDKEHAFEARFALPLNSCYPLVMYKKAGGHNEKLNGYGFQDMIFGLGIELLNTSFIASSRAWALHIWHAKENPRVRHFEAQKNLDFLLKNCKPNSTFIGEVDWSIWWHFHKDRGGMYMMDDRGICWVVNSFGTHRMQLPTLYQKWLQRLGFQIDNQTNFFKIEKALNMGMVYLTGIE